MFLFTKLFALALLLNGFSECANILGVFPQPSISHQVVFHALMKDLAARGHHMTILTTDLMKIDNPNVTQIDLHGSYEVFRREFNFVSLVDTDEYGLMTAFMPVMTKIIDEQLSHPEVKKLIDNKADYKFDVMIVEYTLWVPMLAFAAIFDCPIVGITSLQAPYMIHEQIGNAFNPAIHPEIGFSYKHGELSFGERWNSLKYYLKFQYLSEPRTYREFRRQIKQYFPTVTASIDELKSRLQILMTNTHPAMGFIRPLLPNTIQLGFMHIETPKPLAEGKLKSFLDNSKNGVIYMSFGSNVQSKDLSPKVLQTFLKVFGSLKFDVLWKFEADNLPNKPDNVMIVKWLPQSDLLAHPKIKLFITQGGQQSMEEAIDRAVPMVVIPFLGDQQPNANIVQEKGLGRRFDLISLTEASLKEVIKEVSDPKYKINIQKLRELINDQPMTSREKAVWWTEYVIRHKGAKHLDYPGRLVPFYQKYFLDFIALAVLLFLVALKVVRISVKILCDPKIKRE